MPSSRIVPDLGLTSPSIALSVLVLPAPFGPSRPKISPRRISKLTASTAVLGPYATVRSRTWRIPHLRNGDGGGSAVFGGYRALSARDRLGCQQQRSVLVLLGDDIRACLAASQHLHPLAHRRQGSSSTARSCTAVGTSQRSRIRLGTSLSRWLQAAVSIKVIGVSDTADHRVPRRSAIDRRALRRLEDRRDRRGPARLDSPQVIVTIGVTSDGARLLLRRPGRSEHATAAPWPPAPEAALAVASARWIGRAARGNERSVENAGEGDVEGRVGIDVLCMFDVLRDGGVVAALEDLVDQWCVARSPLPLV